MQISFDDGAVDAFIRLAEHIPDGYTVALLKDGELLPEGSELQPGTDVRFIKADAEGVTYMDIDQKGDPITGDALLRSWEHIAHIHVY